MVATSATAAWNGWPSRWFLLSTVAPLAWLIFSATYVAYRRRVLHRWEVTHEAIYTRTGWLTLHTRIAPINRVQTVQVKQGMLARLFGLGAVECSTASDAIEIGLIDAQVAQQIADHLTAVVNLDTTDAT